MEYKMQYKHHVVEVQNKSKLQQLFQKSKSFPFSFWFSHSNLLKSKDSIEIFNDLQNKQNGI